MSQENVEVVGVGIDVFQAGLERGEFGAAFDAGFLHADIEWIQAPEISARTTRGREEFIESLKRWTEGFDRWTYEIEQLIDAGDGRLVAMHRQSAMGSGSQVPVELRFATVYGLENGSVVRTRNYLDPADALKAAGRRE